MLNLKSELLKKKKELEEQKSRAGGSAVVTSSIKESKKVLPWMKKNSGVEKRNQRDLSEVIVDEKHSKVQAILEAKSKMYDKMTSGNIIPDSEECQMFLVDFEQKSIEAWREKREKGEQIKPDVKVKTNAKQFIEHAKDQWVEYTDSLGRTRTCLKDDLSKLEHMDKKLDDNNKKEATHMSDDMRREEERLKWEESALLDQGEVHYENLRFGEVRELGVGYYGFSEKMEEREEQMKRLAQLRKETERQKQTNRSKKEKQKKMLAARLEKVRLRRLKQLQEQGKEIPASLLEPVKVDSVKDIEDDTEKPTTVIEESVETTVISNKVRDWDEGKEWQPAKPTITPRSWKDPHEERLDEFAPPSFYFAETSQKRPRESNSQIPTKQPKVVIDNQTSTTTASKEQLKPPFVNDNDRIQRLLREVSKSTTTIAPPMKNEEGEKLDRADNSSSSPNAEVVAKPYIATSKSISIKLKPKPAPSLSTKSAFSE